MVYLFILLDIDMALIAGYARSPFTPAKKGQLAKTRSDEIASQVIDKLLSDLNLEGSSIDDLLVGCAFPEAEQGYNLSLIHISEPTRPY